MKEDVESEEVDLDLPERKEPVIKPSWAPVRADIVDLFLTMSDPTI